MWSVFSERVNLYIGQRNALVEASGQSSLLVNLTPTMPWHQRLRQIATHAQDAGYFRKRSRLSVTLSSALCAPVGFVLPHGVHRTEEVSALAAANAASHWGIAATSVRAEPVAGVTGLAAVSAGAFLDSLFAWAPSLPARIVCLRPSWALASQCAHAQKVSVKGIWLEEPDATTLVVPRDGQQAFAQHREQPEHSLGPAPENPDVWMRRSLAALGLDSEELLRLRFHLEGLGVSSSLPKGRADRGLPRPWAAQWRNIEAS